MASKKPRRKPSLENTSSGPTRKRRKRSRSKNPPPEKVESKITSWLIGLLLVLAMAGAYWKSKEKMEEKAMSERYNLSLMALDKMHLKCTVFWREKGIQNACSQALGEQILGSLNDEVELTVIDGRSHKFTAQVKHREGDKIFQVNKDGEVFLNVNGCLAEIRYQKLDVKDVKKLEKQCKPPASQ